MLNSLMDAIASRSALCGSDRNPIQDNYYFDNTGGGGGGGGMLGISDYLIVYAILKHNNTNIIIAS